MSENTDSDLREVHYVGPVTADRLRAESVTAADVREKRVSYHRLVEAGINPGVATKIRRWHSLPWTFGGEETQLEKRSETVRGLREGEREWVAASSGERGDSEPSGRERSTTPGDWTPSSERTEASPVDSPTGLRDGDWTPTGTTGNTDDPRTGSDWSPEPGTQERTVDTETDGSGAADAAESAWRRRAASDPVVALEGITPEIATVLADANVTTVRRLATSDPEHVSRTLDVDVARVVEWKRTAEAFLGQR